MKRFLLFTLMLCASSYGVRVSVSPDGGVNQAITSTRRIIYPIFSDFIPSGMIQWLTSNDGTNATASVGSDAAVVQRPVLEFDGVGDELGLSYLFNGATNETAHVIYEYDLIFPAAEDDIAFFGGESGI